MKIAMLTNNYKPFVGGVPISVERQAQELVRLGHEVTVFAPEYAGYVLNEEKKDREGLKQTCVEGQGISDEREVSERRLRIIRFGTRKCCMENGMVYPKLVLKEVLQVFEQESFDIIHTHHPMFVGTTALYLGKKYHIPVVYTYHTRYEDYLHYLPVFNGNGVFGTWKGLAKRLGQERIVPAYMKWFTNQCDLILAPTAGMQKQIRKNGTRIPIAVFPTGLAETFYLRRPQEASRIRSKYISKEGSLFCTTGRLEEEKNPHFLLEGIRELKRRMKRPFRVLLIGDGSMRRELEAEAKRLDIEREVCFVGNVANEEVNCYLQACDAFLFASKSETQGIVLAEAFAAGLPVVAVDATGVEDIVVDGVNGYRTEEDTKIWAEKAAEVLERRKEMQEQAIQTGAGYRATRLAAYEELLYGQCIGAKRMEEKERGYERETDRQTSSAKHILRVFKTS